MALQPRSRGYLTLASTDPQQPPKMQPNYFLSEHELDVIVEAARIAYRLANTTVFIICASNNTISIVSQLRVRWEFTRK